MTDPTPDPKDRETSHAPETPRDASSGGASDAAAADARLPSDRDEAPHVPPDPQHAPTREAMRQAHRDVESGIQDTERIGTPNDVPSSGRKAG